MSTCIARRSLSLNGTGYLDGTARQRGAIGLLLMVMIGLSIGLLIIGYARNVSGSDVVDPRTILALSKAREALLGYATTYRDTHTGEGFGYFPCPDMGSGTEGQAASACGATDVTVIGRLPWKTLDLAPLRDASGECLWYAVSGNYKNNPKTNDLVNHDTNGLIEVMAADGSGFIAGATPPQRAVAVVFAPGAILPGQDRTLAATNPPAICGGNYDPANYLDTDAASSIDNAAAAIAAHALSRFIAAEHSDVTASASDAFNDQLMPILPDELFARHVKRRTDFEGFITDPLTGMLRRSADCLAAFGRSNDFGLVYKQLPWAAPLDVGTFGSAAQYSDSTNALSGRLPRDVPLSAGAAPFPTSIYAATPMLDESRCAGWNSVDEFWNKWQDHLFYAVGRAHRPKAGIAFMNNPCNIDECIDVQDPDNIKTNMAAVVIFSGERLPGQDRNNSANPSYVSTDKADPANYLEGANVAAIQTNPTGGSSPNRLFSKIASNDTIMCLRSLPGALGTELFVDPTCGATARCVTDGGLLAGYRAGATNNCRVGTSGIAAACKAIARDIDINNCPGNGTTFDSSGQPYSCERGARDFMSYECLQGFASARCQLAHTALINCQ
jgi:hypothetical protein